MSKTNKLNQWLCHNRLTGLQLAGHQAEICQARALSPMRWAPRASMTRSRCLTGHRCRPARPRSVERGAAAPTAEVSSRRPRGDAAGPRPSTRTRSARALSRSSSRPWTADLGELRRDSGPARRCARAQGVRVVGARRRSATVWSSRSLIRRRSRRARRGASRPGPSCRR
jgi:hypothetical protein